MHFDSSFFAGNRRALIKKLPGSLIVITAHSELQQSRDVPYHFEQENNFWYLTGIEEPEWRLVIDTKNDSTYLVAPKVRESRALWQGTLSPEEVESRSGIGKIITREEFSAALENVKKQYRKVYTVTPQTQLREHFDFLLNPAPQMLTRELKGYFKEIVDCRPELSLLRGVKQSVELEALQKAIDITIDGAKAALSQLRSYSYEYEFEAELSKQFRARGGSGHAFNPIIAGGKNAYTVHYESNNDPLSENEWLLFDIGARYERYCADLARAVPPKEPTKQQRDIYAAILTVHDYAASLLTPGQSIEEYYEQTEQAMGEELLRLGLITEKTREQIRAFFPNAISHGLGIDVHDPLGKVDEFTAGMVLTVEPGIHIAEQKLGMRLESVYHIANKGPVSMTAGLPTDLDELKALIG